MLPLISKKVHDFENEALLAVCLSCSKYVMDQLDKDKNKTLFLLAKKIHDHFVKGARYSKKDAKKINDILTNVYNPILNTSYNPGSLLIVLLNHLAVEAECKVTIDLLKAHNIKTVEKLFLSLEYHYEKHFKHSNNIISCFLGTMTIEEMVRLRDVTDVKTFSSGVSIKIELEEETFTLYWVNKSLIRLFSLEYNLDIDFTDYVGTKIEELTFSNDLLEDFKLFIYKNYIESEVSKEVYNKELIYLKETLKLGE